MDYQASLNQELEIGVNRIQLHCRSDPEVYDPIPGTEIEFDVDTLLLSVGLVPENELSRSAGVVLDKRTNGAIVDETMMTSIPGIFACGNVLHVHDLVDFVSKEAEIAGKAAAKYIKSGKKQSFVIPIKTDGKIRYTVPQIITEAKDVTVYFRVSDVYKNAKIIITDGDKAILSKSKAKLTPGEMEKIMLKTEQIKNVKELHFSLEV